MPFEEAIPSLTKSQIKTLIDETVFYNEDELVLADAVNYLLKVMLENTYGSPPEGGTDGMPVWTDEILFHVDMYCFYNGKPWRSLINNNLAIEPGTDPDSWETVPTMELIHPQNTDYRVDDHFMDVTVAGVIDMTTTTNRTKNFIKINLATAGEISLQTYAPGVKTNINQLIFVKVVAGSEAVTFLTNTYQEIPPEDSLILEAGDWAIFKGGVQMGNLTQLLQAKPLIGGGKEPQVWHGFPNRTDSNAATVTGDTLSIAPAVTSFDVFVNGVKFTKSAALEVDLAAYNVGDLIYASINESGVLQASTTAWDIKSFAAIPAAIAFKHAGGYIITDERHSSTRNVDWHSWAHLTIGTMYKSGLAGSFEEGVSGLEFQIETGFIYDEDIRFEIGTENTTTLWYRDGASSMKVVVGNGFTFADSVGDGTGLLQYDDGSGTLAEVSNNNFATNWIFATNDPDNPIYTVISQGDYNTITAARNATFPTINLSTAEWKLIYRVIYKRSGTDIEFEEAADFRTVQTGVPTSQIQFNSHDQLINRDAANSHPIAAITGLQEELNIKVIAPATNTSGKIPAWLGDDSKELEDGYVVDELPLIPYEVVKPALAELRDGAAATADDATLTTGEAMTLDVYADKYAILMYNDSEGSVEACKIASNTTGGVLTFTGSRIHTTETTNIDWCIVEPYIFENDEELTILHDLSLLHGVIVLPPLGSVTQGLRLEVITELATATKYLFIITETNKIAKSDTTRMMLDTACQCVELIQHFATDKWILKQNIISTL